MASHPESKLKKLSLFALDRKTALPLARVPFYAEVGVRTRLGPPPVPLDDRFGDAMRGALNSTDDACLESEQCADRVTTVLRAGLSRLLSTEARNELAAANESATEFLVRVFRRARDARAGATLLGLDIDMLEPLLDVALRAEAEARGLALAAPLVLPPIAWAHPMGILATDHAGYLSFDLSRLPDTVYNELLTSIEARRLDPEAKLDTTIWVYPMAQEEHRFDALAQGRFAHDAILLKIQLDAPELPGIMKNYGILSLQNPDLTDWRLSPGSFASNPAALVGQDGCETLLPANVAQQEFHFYQVLRLIDPGANLNLPAPLNDQIKLGLVHEYRLAWYPLGHSLGQILYSLPLAPGESVNLAVIDWSRQDTTQRTEQTKLDEQLIHDQHRDRTITETVRGAVGEFQEGSSFMAGAAMSVGASTAAGAAIGSVVPGIGTAIGAGVGLLAGLALSIGGSSSDSSGSRSVASNTVQKLSDNISQASSAMRELQSTVVVQSTQSEREAIETRTVVNYNHSHTLTVLYYEVLRHFRVVTELARRRPAVLVRLKTHWFDGTTTVQEALEHRAALEAALLDTKFAGGFDSVERLNRLGKPWADFTKPLPQLAAPPPDPSFPPLFHYFTFEMTTGGFHREQDNHKSSVEIRSTLLFEDGASVHLVNIDGGPVLTNFGAFSEADKVNKFTAVPQGVATVPGAKITGIRLAVGVFPTDGDTAKVSFSHIKLTAMDAAGPPGVLILDQPYENGHLIITNVNDEMGRVLVLPTLRPLPAPPPTYAAADVADHAKGMELLAHLTRHNGFYSRAILLGQNPVERASDLDGIKFPDGSTALDHLESRPLEVLGNYVAYPCSDGNWTRKVLDLLEPAEEALDMPIEERLVTLPTRGVFAEAKLGHCNASEEIDNTRFWDWQQSPIPHMAPEIAPVQPVSPQPQQQNVSPTPFPASLVNIVNPPNAPDPTGMAAVLNLLGTSNIFRDMSGRAEVAQLLGKLSDNSITAAQAASEASRIQTKYGSNLQGLGGSGSSGIGSAGTGSPRAMPNQPSATNRDLQDLGHVLGRAQADNLITPNAAQSLFTQAAQDAYAPASRLAFSVDATTAEGAKLVTLTPLHADEADQVLLSYEYKQFAIFVPQAVLFSARDVIGDVNVHVFFAAGGVQGERQTDFLLHGLRGASNQSHWVTIAVPGILNGSNPISEAEILDCLRATDIKGSPKSLRLSGHSRGTDSLMASISLKKITNLALIDRVTFLDEAVEHASSNAPNAGAVTYNRVANLKQMGVPANKMVSYEVGNRSRNTTTGQSARVAEATYVELGPNCMAAVGCVRLIQDAVQLRPDIQAKLDAKPGLKALVDSLPLPPRGSFTTKGVAGKTDFAQFCQDNATEIAAITAKVGNANESVLAFVNAQNLTSYAPRQLAWGIASHHLFVAEIAQELTD